MPQVLAVLGTVGGAVGTAAGAVGSGLATAGGALANVGTGFAAGLGVPGVTAPAGIAGGIGSGLATGLNAYQALGNLFGGAGSRETIGAPIGPRPASQGGVGPGIVNDPSALLAQVNPMYQQGQPHQMAGGDFVNLGSGGLGLGLRRIG